MDGDGGVKFCSDTSEFCGGNLVIKNSGERWGNGFPPLSQEQGTLLDALFA